LFDVHYPYGITMLAEYRGEISETKVSLVLKTNEHDGTRSVTFALRVRRTLNDG
jgi:hypothetical protein